MNKESQTFRTMKTVLCSVLLVAPIAACSSGQHAVETSAVVQHEVRQHYGACTEDRRRANTTVEVPSVTQTRGVPPTFLQQLQTKIIAFGRQHNVWHVVPTTSEVDNVVVLALVVESWEPDANGPSDSGVLAMRLELTDKAKQCGVGHTTGEGFITSDADGTVASDGIRNIAQSAGWFVGTTLLHTM